MAQRTERRRRRRIDVALPIKIEYNKEKISARIKNISLLGVYLESDKEIPVGTALNIWVDVPKTQAIPGRQINCRGVVFRCQSLAGLEPKARYGVGIFFRSFLEGAEEALGGYIDNVLWQEKMEGRIYTRRRKGARPLLQKKKRRGGRR